MTYDEVIRQPGWGKRIQHARAIEPEEIARELRQTVPEHIERDLGRARILWLWTSKSISAHGKSVVARTRLINPLTAAVIREFYLDDDQKSNAFDWDTTPHFVVEVSADWWDSYTDRQRMALIDHELCHMAFDDDGKPRLRPHDLQEFSAVVQRNGLWAADVQYMAKAMQLHLPGFADAALKQAVRDTQALCDAPITVKPALHGDPALGRAFDALRKAVDDNGATVRLHVPATGQTAVLGGKHDDDGVVGTIGQAVGE